MVAALLAQHSAVDPALPQAIKLYEKKLPRQSLDALSKCKPSGEVSFYIGLNYRALGDHAKARENLIAALEASYSNPYLLYALIEAEHALGDKQGGLAHFKLMLERYPGDEWTHMLLGNAYYASQQDEKARGEYEAALAGNPALPNANFRLGHLDYQSGNFPLAAKHFRHELKLNPSHADANLFLGQTLHVLGQHEQATQYLRRAIALDPGSPLAYRSLAGALTALKRFEEATEVAVLGERAFPSDPTFPASLAPLYVKLGRKKDAKEAAERTRILTVRQLGQEKVIGATEAVSGNGDIGDGKI